jgi:hypothetical protein
MAPDSRALDRLIRLWPVLALALAVCWVLELLSVGETMGLFSWIGVDYGHYWAQARLLLDGQPELMYSLAALDGTTQLFAGYATQAYRPLHAGGSNYPPLFAWLFAPFARLDPLVGLVLWSLLNAGSAAYLVWRTAHLLPARHRLAVAALLALSLPVAYSVWLGNVALLIAIATGECYLALRAGREVRAGLWLALLALKPQHGLLFALLLLFERRWRALSGATLGGLAMYGGSFLAVGWPTFEAYLGSLLRKTESAGLSEGSYVVDMINLRKLVLTIVPALDNPSGVTLATALGLALSVAVLLLWRGPWEPRSSRFSAWFTLAASTMLLVSPHSHLYGLAVLAVPLTALLRERPNGPALGCLGLLTLAGATFTFALRQVPALPLTVLLLLLVAGLAWLTWRAGRVSVIEDPRRVGRRALEAVS